MLPWLLSLRPHNKHKLYRYRRDGILRVSIRQLHNNQQWQVHLTVLVESTEVVAAPTIVVDAPSREETKQPFAELSSALQQASSAHEEVRTEMQSLATRIEELR